MIRAQRTEELSMAQIATTIMARRSDAGLGLIANLNDSSFAQYVIIVPIIDPRHD